VRPFFPTLWFVIFSGTPFLYFWLDTNIEAGRSFLNIVEDGATMAPGIVAVLLLAGMLFSLPVYAITWGVEVIREFLRRTDRSDIIARRDETIEELRAQLEEAQAKSEQAQAQSEQDKEILRNQIRRSGQEPEA